MCFDVYVLYLIDISLCMQFILFQPNYPSDLVPQTPPPSKAKDRVACSKCPKAQPWEENGDD